ncbi:helix-turn-helix domain-containing protein [Streptomyces sp. NPDC059002]|uniref:helix-turn-helix domain-containing protein n=1 Tax=Streptomyces sp. NPDC059002 TaxID=3346690 RepID=UPI00368132B4
MKTSGGAVIPTRLSTDDLPRGDRFTWWHDRAATGLIPSVMASQDAADFSAKILVLPLGPVQILSMTYPSLVTCRTPKLIRRSDPEHLQVALTLRGAPGIAQADRQTVCRTGDLTYFDSSLPYEGWSRPQDAPVELVIAQIPSPLIPLPHDALARLTAARIPADEGFGALLSQFLIYVTRNAHEFHPQDAPRLSTALRDLFADTVARRLDVPLPDEDHHRAQFLRIQDFIQQRLDDAGLTPEHVAAAHHISLRSLYRLFQAQGTTVAAFIRQKRLESARRDLADPMLRAHPIHAIAARWGFPRAADFTRAFRTAYGMPPRDYRHLAHSATPTEYRHAFLRTVPGTQR